MTTSLNEKAGFLAAILAEPDEDTPRLVYADWLEDRDDPRAEYLRLGVTLPTMTKQREYIALRTRYGELQRSLDINWLAAISDLVPGKRIAGPVTRTTREQADIDLSPYTSYFHVQDMSWRRVPDCREMFHLGDVVEGYILHVDEVTRRIALGWPPQWRNIAKSSEYIAETYPVGMVTVALLNGGGFQEGWFARLTPHVPGMIPRENLSADEVARLEQHFSESTHVPVRVTEIDFSVARVLLAPVRSAAST